MRLPKLKVRKFTGKIHEWTEFWDSFNSAIHENESLSNVDRFTYLRGLVEEPAKSAIAGFSLTEVNYSTVQPLHCFKGGLATKQLCNEHISTSR